MNSVFAPQPAHTWNPVPGRERERDEAGLAELRHEIGNALTPATGYADMLLRRVPAWADERDRRALEAVADGLKRIRRLLRDPAAHAGSPAAGLTWCAIHTALSEALSQVPPERLGDLDVRCPSDSSVGGAWNGGHVTQVLANLLDNACKYSPPGTPITVDVVAAPGWVDVRVRDRGIGLRPPDLEAIFHGHRTEAARATAPGSGIGLPLCRRLAEACGGTLTADATPGGGSTFHLRLPRSACPAGVRTAAHAGCEEHPSHPGRPGPPEPHDLAEARVPAGVA